MMDWYYETRNRIDEMSDGIVWIRILIGIVTVATIVVAWLQRPNFEMILLTFAVGLVIFYALAWWQMKVGEKAEKLSRELHAYD